MQGKDEAKRARRFHEHTSALVTALYMSREAASRAIQYTTNQDEHDLLEEQMRLLREMQEQANKLKNKE